MKKLLALILILVLSFTSFACGGSGEEANDPTTGGENGVVDSTESGNNGDGEEADGEDGKKQESGASNDVKDEDINPSDYETDDVEAEFDFKFEAAKNFGLSSVVEKADYKKFEDLALLMEKRLDTGIKKSIGGEYSIFSDYEAEEFDDIKEIAYAIGMESDDTDKRMLEGGVYHSTKDKYFQYVTLISESYFTVKSSDIDTIIKDLEKGMGLKISKSRLKKAIEIAFDTATKKQDYFSLYDVETIKGSGYTETISMSVDGFATEDNEIGYYVSVERERCYN